jgi:hypothetical protein
MPGPSDYTTDFWVPASEDALKAFKDELGWVTDLYDTGCRADWNGHITVELSEHYGNDTALDAIAAIDKFRERWEIKTNDPTSFGAVLNSFFDVQDEIEKRARVAALLFAELTDDTTFINHPGSYDLCKIDRDYIEFKWEETWRYGGHASHNLSLPTHLLLDPTGFDRLREKKQQWDAAKSDAATREAEARKVAELAKLAELKAKYPEEAAND